MPTASQGHGFRLHYFHEDNGFNAAPTDSTAKTLGWNWRMTTAEGRNGFQEIFGPGSRIPIDIIEETFDGAWAAQFEYENPWWLEMFFGAPSSVNNGDGSHTHTYSGETPNTSRFVIGREDSGKERIISGAAAVDGTVSITIGGNIQITLRGVYADENTNDPVSLTSQPTPSDDLLTFADAQLQRASSTIGYVQDGAFTLENPIDLIYEWGSRVAIDYAPRTLMHNIDISKINEAGATTNVEDFYGGSTSVQEDLEGNEKSMTLTLDNGVAAGSGINKIVASYTNTVPERYGEQGLGDPTADMIEQRTFRSESASFAATNETSTAV